MRTGMAWIVAGAMTAAVTMSATDTRAEKELGVGIILGEPTGLSAKYWIGPTRAIDAAAAWSFSENDSFQFHSDYLIHHHDLFHADARVGRPALYYGIGGRVKLKDRDGRGRNEDDVLLGMRVPVGLSYRFARAPIELFVEVVPILDVVPDTDFDINGAIGARFYFK